MRNLKVALLQISALGIDKARNQAKGIQACRQAAELGADIALLPEMWSIGYTPYDYDRAGAILEWSNLAVDQGSTFVTAYRDLAVELNMTIALTYLEKWPGSPRNVVSLIDRHGEILFTYAKVHTCDFEPMEAALTPGDGFFVSTLDTAQGDVKVGAMICFDREFPESARVLMLKGAEIILTPNSCELEINRLSQYRARAYENMLALAMTNYPSPQCNGNSIGFDGIAFDENGSREMQVVEAGENEGIFLAEYNLEALRQYRQQEVWGNAFRKPDIYQPLLLKRVKDPFVRSDAKR